MNKTPFVAATLMLSLAWSIQAEDTTLRGEPFGYVKVSIAPGTGSSKTASLISIPLLEQASITGNASGLITGVTATTITSADAGWAPGELASASEPYLLEITSGAAQGRMLLLSTATANTSDTVTVDAVETARFNDLSSLGIAHGDSYRIRPVDTLLSFFGTPQTTGVHGGVSAAAADTVTIVENGTATTYYYKTDANPPRWTRVAFGNPDASNTRISPHSGLQYSRLPATPLEFIATGTVPDGQRQVAVRNSGTTLLSSFWPVGQTLAGLSIQNLQNWGTGSSAAVADTVVMTTPAGAQTFFHDGSNWRRVAFGNPVANTNSVPVGASVMINRKGAASGFADFQQDSPYNLD